MRYRVSNGDCELLIPSRLKPKGTPHPAATWRTLVCPDSSFFSFYATKPALTFFLQLAVDHAEHLTEAQE